MKIDEEKKYQDKLKQKLEYCKNCSYCVWLIGVGQGVMCHHPDNQKYLLENQSSPVLVGLTPDDCEFQNSDKLSKELK